MKSCTLLISTYNWPEALDLCLKSVMQQTVLPSEIVIADDGSNHLTHHVIQHYTDLGVLKIRHVWHEDNGFRKTIILNKAISTIRTDYIIQIDGDVVLNENFVKDHLSVQEEGCFIRGTRAHITIEGRKHLLESKNISLSFYSKGIRNRFNALRLPFLTFLMTKKTYSGNNVRGCNIAYWTKDILAVNGYNNMLSGWGHEDEELALRFVNLGLAKKSVKFKCIQYHIYHPLSSREQEESHNNELLKVVENRVTACRNGIQQL